MQSIRRRLFVSTTIAAWALASLAIPLVAGAHHSAAMFDTSRVVTVQGVVTDMAWKNPHSYMTVQTDTGPLVLELGPPSTMGPLGLKRDSIKVGDRITLHAHPPRRGTMAMGREIVRPDGSTVPLMINAGVRPQPSAQATSIAGTWVPEGFFGFLQSRSKWSLTEKGAAALRASNVNLSSQNECIPVGAPMLMHYPTANRIEVGKDLVLLHIDWMDAERVVHLDGRKPPASTKPTLQGYSTGRWEGTTLVIDTTHFAEHRDGNALGLPSGLRKHLVERFSLSEDRRHLTYAFVLEDPDWLAAPVKQSIQWDYQPELKPSGEKCDVGAASRFLKEE